MGRAMIHVHLASDDLIPRKRVEAKHPSDDRRVDGSILDMVWLAIACHNIMYCAALRLIASYSCCRITIRVIM